MTWDDPTEPEVTELECGHVEFVEVTPLLRWQNGILQQAWKHQRKDTLGGLFAPWFEWRDVPIDAKT